MSRDSSALLTVRDAAQRLNVTPRTLKYYEERGLVTPSRSEGRYRLYDEHDLEQFARILRLRALGFSLHGITEMLKRPLDSLDGGRRRYSQESLQQIADALTQQIDTLDARIAAVRRELREAQTVRTELAGDLDYLRQRLAGVPSETLIGERLAATRRRKEAAKATEPQGSSPSTKGGKRNGNASGASPTAGSTRTGHEGESASERKHGSARE